MTDAELAPLLHSRRDRVMAARTNSETAPEDDSLAEPFCEAFLQRGQAEKRRS
jgi:hypothetical protein